MRVVLATGDMDWQGLYVNGELVTQGHSVRLDELAEAIISRFPRLDITYEQKTVNYDWMEDRGDLPNDIKKVKFDD